MEEFFIGFLAADAVDGVAGGVAEAVFDGDGVV